MPDELITPELRALIGKEWPPVVNEVDRTGIRMWAQAVGFEDPVYHDEEAARERGFERLPAPPGFVGFPRTRPGDAVPGPPIRGLHPDLLRSLNGGTEFEYRSPILAGDELVATTTITD
ncbi:MAG: FAS1-like dehydratase domain-containing protein, partial [Actinomycetota bacterium]